MEQPKHRAPEHPIHDELSCGKTPVFYTDVEARQLKRDNTKLQGDIDHMAAEVTGAHQAAHDARMTRDAWARQQREVLLEEKAKAQTKLRATKRGAFVGGLLVGAVFATIMVTYVGWAIGAF